MLEYTRLGAERSRLIAAGAGADDVRLRRLERRMRRLRVRFAELLIPAFRSPRG